VLDPARPIIIIAAPGREHESAVRLGRIGFDHVAGYLENGLRALDSRPDLIAFTEHLSAQSAAERLSSNRPPLAPPLVIDVRTPREHEQKHIDGSVSVPLNRLADHLQSLPRDRPLLLYCAGGYRSSLAASLLQRAGFGSVAEIAGGFAAWEAAKLPVAAPVPGS
jgi:rhodanese-related sulfurtransferase